MSYAAALDSPEAPAFRHQPPSVATQWVVAMMMGGVMRPLVRTLEATGRADRFLSAMAAQGRKRSQENPFVRYAPGPQDVIVMTFPKSGTNWMMQMAYQLIHHGKGEFEHIHDVVPWPDIETMPGFMRRYAIPLAQAKWESAPEHKRVIKTHFSWDLIPYAPDARYIAVIRDPKDVFVSSYFFLRDGVYGPAMPKPETWYRAYLSKNFMMGGSWASNTAGFWAARQRPNVLVLSFKQMKKDLRGTVKTVAAFLGMNAPDSLIEDVSLLSSFEHMKRIDHKFHMGKLSPWREPGSMIRKGSQGGSSELITPAQQREMDAHFQAELRELGCDFPYDEFCDVAASR